ncbi:hypothetical protein C8F04DRAFT_1186478 [Mycena alexandri]|uniref:Uncharacterized protein n=1 Tax=Mycena alexandri TaxID=1745969 RepID=A0AAD6X3H7_9AGAR|nr:hypothetical protein C8F04DRAFT_1186478 [Mycena alexandri]
MRPPTIPTLDSTNNPPTTTTPHIPETIHTSRSFLEMGIQIQHQQRVLNYKFDTNFDPEPHLYVKLHNEQDLLQECIDKFRALQRFYMPFLHLVLSKKELPRFDSDQYYPARTINLYLPSEISDSQKRHDTCVAGLPELEAELRDAEVREAQYQIELATIKESLSLQKLKALGARDSKVHEREQVELRRAKVRKVLWTARAEHAEAAAELLRS